MVTLNRKVTRGTKQVEGGWQFRHDVRHRVASPIRMTEEQVEAFTVAVQCKSLVFVGTVGDQYFGRAWEKRKASVKHLTEVQVEGAHHVHLDQPSLLVPHVASFLADLLSTSKL